MQADSARDAGDAATLNLDGAEVRDGVPGSTTARTRCAVRVAS